MNRGETDTGALTITEVTSPDEIEEYQDLERRIWGSSDLEVVPAHVLLTHRRYGGLLLVGRTQDGTAVALLLGFPGLKGGSVVHCSHLLGVMPECRSRDIGYQMKCRQRERVLQQGLDLVVWTFDPLETRNARLNLGRLGAVSHEYTPNLYGVMRDGLNAGLESDRLTVEWRLRHPDVEARLAGRRPPLPPAPLLAAGVPLLTRTGLHPKPAGEPPLLYLDEILCGQDAPRMLIEVPGDFQRLKRADFEAARIWRGGVRRLFEDLFARGYGALDMLTDEDQSGRRRCYYLIAPFDDYVQREER
jgi:predicted GNAT superfamily acetyltransferase